MMTLDPEKTAKNVSDYLNKTHETPQETSNKIMPLFLTV